MPTALATVGGAKPSSAVWRICTAWVMCSVKPPQPEPSTTAIRGRRWGVRYRRLARAFTDATLQNDQVFWLGTIHCGQRNTPIKSNKAAMVLDSQTQQIQGSELLGTVHVRMPKKLTLQQADVVWPLHVHGGGGVLQVVSIRQRPHQMPSASRRRSISIVGNDAAALG